MEKARTIATTHNDDTAKAPYQKRVSSAFSRLVKDQRITNRASTQKTSKKPKQE